MKWMATEAQKYAMEIGLKNSLDIVDALTPTIDFAVNEQCAQLSECDRYASFLAAGKPVFHIEYPTPLNATAAKGPSCTSTRPAGMSTILKNMALDGPAVYCDGSYVDTPTKGGSSPPRPTKTATPRPTSTRPTTTRPTTTRPTTTRPTTAPTPTPSTRPTTTAQPPTTIRTSSAAPTTTAGPGNGCKQKHWDQCGGNDWKGCTVCEVSFLVLHHVCIESEKGLIVWCSRRIRARVFRRRGIISVCKKFFYRGGKRGRGKGGGYGGSVVVSRCAILYPSLGLCFLGVCDV